MNTYILVFDSFVQFEVAVAAYFMKTKGEIHTLGLNANPVESAEGFSVNPARILEEVRADEVDLLIIPGGETEGLSHNEDVLKLIRDLHEAGRGIGAICGGVSVLQAAGVLQGRIFTGIESSGHEHAGTSGEPAVAVDDNIVTAQPNGYVDFALELGRLMDIYQDQDDYQETVDFFKYFKSV